MRSLTCRRGVAALVGSLVLVATGCAQTDDTVLEPLSGLPGQEPLAAAPGGATIDAEVLGVDVRLDDLPAGMYDDTPPGFGERPFEELDLPPDEPLPPPDAAPPPPPVAAPAPAAPAPPPAPAPPRPAPTAPPAARPSALDPAAVRAIGDYCTLFRQNGQALVLAGDALGGAPPAQVQEVFTFAAAVFGRGGELGPASLRASHDAIAAAMQGYLDVLADYGFDVERAAGDDAGLRRLAAIESPQFGAAIDAVAGHVAGACGVSIV